MEEYFYKDCPDNFTLNENECIENCPEDWISINSKCEKPCQQGTIKKDGKCVGKKCYVLYINSLLNTSLYY